MDNPDEIQDITVDICGPLSNLNIKLNWRKVALVTLITTVVLIMSSVLFLTYPLETLIVGLLIGSVLSMRRG